MGRVALLPIGPLPPERALAQHRLAGVVRRLVGEVVLVVPLTRHLAAFVSYVYYKHDFGNDVLLPITFPHALNRQGVNIGVNAWLPLR